jgi:hypothetical protein
MRSSQTIGVEASGDMVRWLWDNHFSAVAGDAVAFETQPLFQKHSVSPPKLKIERHSLTARTGLHDYLLV